MPRNGTTGVYTRTDGTRTGTTVWTQAKNAGVKIVSTGHDTHDQDIATALNDCLTQDNKIKPSASFIPNADGTLDLGSSAVTWNNQYLKGNLHLIDGAADGARFYNASNYVELRAPGTLAANRVFTLPNADGTNGQVLATNGSGQLSFANATGVARLGFTIIGTTTSTIELTWANPGTYAGFLVLFTKIRADTAGANLNCFLTSNTGGSWNSVTNIASRTTGTTRTEYTSSTLPNLATTGEGFISMVLQQNNSTIISGNFDALYNNNTDGYVSATGSIYTTSIFNIDGIRFSVSSGNFNLNNATLTVYGLPA